MRHLPPFDTDHPLLRGNLHGHSTHSDGALSPEEVVSAYYNLGYDFIALSDHLWRDERYAAKRVLDASALNKGDFITIASAELHCFGKAYDNDGLWHIVANGLPLDFAVAGDDETGPEMVQRALDAGAFVSIAHPEWYSMTMEEAMSVSAAHAVEIHNYSCVVNSNRGSGVAVADYLLQEGKKITFTATDDSHFHTPDWGGGWVMVAADLDAASIVTALKQGRHYSSSGAVIKTLALDGTKLIVETDPAQHIMVSGQGHMAQSAHGNNITRAEFDLAEFDADWFRVTILNKDGGRAWSNPYWKKDLFETDRS
ncbi:MAG: phosphotransferase [Candidatus Puniceispirillaceae bacterium]